MPHDIFSNPNTWYAVAFFIFVGASLKFAIAKIKESLVGYQQRIQKDFEDMDKILQDTRLYLESQRMREKELEETLQAIKLKTDQSLKEYTDMLESEFERKKAQMESALAAKKLFLETALEKRVEAHVLNETLRLSQSFIENNYSPEKRAAITRKALQ